MSQERVSISDSEGLRKKTKTHDEDDSTEARGARPAGGEELDEGLKLRQELVVGERRAVILDLAVGAEGASHLGVSSSQRRE